MTDARQASTIRPLVGLTAALAVLAAMAIALTISGLRSDAMEMANREQSELAMVISRELSASDKTVETALDGVEAMAEALHPTSPREFREAFASAEIETLLKNELAAAPKTTAIFVAAENGEIIASTLQNLAPGASVAGESEFQYLKSADIRSTHVGLMRSTAITDEKAILFGRRIVAANGDFLGVVQVAMNPSFYYSIFSATSTLENKSILVARPDGTVLLRYPLSSDSNLHIPPKAPWHRLVAAGGGTYESPGYFDDVARLVVVRPLPDSALVVNVAQSKDAILAVWRRRSIEIGCGALLAFLCAGFLARSHSGHFRRLQQSESTLAANGRDLALLNARFASVLDNMPHGVALFAKDRRLIVANKQYGEMYGLRPEDVAPGTLLDQILAHRVAKGIFVDNSEYYLKTRLADSQAPSPTQSLDRLSNGRVVFISRRPMLEGGWLAVHEDVTARQLAEDRIQNLALYDQLTGAANRALLLREMTHWTENAEGAASDISMLLIDLDEFKAVNDTYGHPFGDSLLKAVASRLSAVVRDRGIVARIGGDEFAVLHTHAGPGGADSHQLAQEILEKIREPFEIEGYMLAIRPSIGLATNPAQGSDVETLLKNADLALYCAKTEGRDRVAVFEPSLERHIREQRALKAELAEAIACNQFEVHYQPIVDARTRETIDVEALVRWRHPERGMIRPDTFITLAEQTGQIQAIGAFVLFEACRAGATFPDAVGISVNLSPAQFTRGGVVELVAAALAESGLAPHRLTLEVTETALMENIESSRGVLSAIRDMGVRIALDDFGTGYSSLSYLQSFNLDKIKIDRSFVASMETNARTQSIVALIASIAGSLGATTIAEGVETQLQLDLVVAAGCDAVQGYFFSTPGPLEALKFGKAAAKGAAQRAA